MQTPLEFAQDNSRTGYRLERLEVFNWGTFHDHVAVLTPDGHTALLCGANGSGKSTLVDALLTLLVPNQRRGYNQASGALTKKERDERSYVLGAYGKMQGDEPTSRTRHLRGKDAYSVLLASFSNTGLEGRAVLAQVFYHQNGALNKFFVFSPKDLRVVDHFSGFDHVRGLRKALREAGAEVYDTFSSYSKTFRRAFGLRSEKALDLFNQTVSIKVIGDLDDFVRTHMLESGEVQEHIDKLHRHFEDLTRTQDAIKKAEDQLGKLRPIDRDGAQYVALGQRIEEVRGALEVLPAVFARRRMTLLQKALEDLSRSREALDAARRSAQEQLDGLRGHERKLDIAIASDEVGQQIRAVEREIEQAVSARERLHGVWRQYVAALEALGLAPPEHEDGFRARRTEVQDLHEQAEAHLAALEEERDGLVACMPQLKAEEEALREELDSLQGRHNQIPGGSMRLRDRLTHDLDLSAEELPFVGELLQVRSEERAWEGAIERLLHSFALRVLVPQRHYREVNAYVHRTHLGGRLVYSRIPHELGYRPLREDDPARLYNKLEIHPDTPYADWLHAQLTQRYDHVCCGVEDLERERRALTQNGLIKRGGDVHEKDDRRRLDDRRSYVLGWDNRAKIEVLEREWARLQKDRSEAEQKKRHLERRQTALRRRQTRMADVLRYDDYRALDWQREARRVEALEDQKTRLEAGANNLQRLRSEREALLVSIRQAEQAVRDVEAKLTRLQSRREGHEAQRAQDRNTLSRFREKEVAAYGPTVERELRQELHLDTFEEVREAVRATLLRRSDTAEQEHHRIELSIVRAMQRYKSDYPVETGDVDAHPASLPDFQRFLQTIEHDDLPRHRQRFGKLLRKNMLEDVSFFEDKLHRGERRIRDKVDALNASLRTIDYTPSTYIQLRASATADAEVRQFKHLLRNIFADNTGDAATNEASFERVRQLLDRFAQEERWTQKVTDVRNWLTFGVEERYLETDEEKDSRAGSDGLSGGQKAKLAYTILAAAIAYQFGLDQGEVRSDSFRFVVIDEAFSKIDEDNARYAMELFRKLDLQLLVVSPLGATRVVEDFIGACHFVVNNAEGTSSQVRTLTIEEYRNEKAQALEEEQGHLVVLPHAEEGAQAAPLSVGGYADTTHARRP